MMPFCQTAPAGSANIMPRRTNTRQPTPIPVMLSETLSEFGVPAVDQWWAGLDEPARGEVIQLWLDASSGQPAVPYVSARFVDATDPEESPELWHDDFYEYLVNHEVYLLYQYRFHICTQHPAARAAVASGFIPADFACPLAHQDCPMRQLLQLAPGRAVRLRLAFKPCFDDTRDAQRPISPSTFSQFQTRTPAMNGREDISSPRVD
ncbi:MAG: hypothetical protein JWR69_911 [Pedosphaera sp.]|nr:hypothetical protein [Pedosphaera sp.]